MAAQPTGTFCWADLMAPDQRRESAFYEALVGWRVDPPGDRFMGYANAYLAAGDPARPVAGIGPVPPGEDAPPAAWSIYLATDDADVTAREVRANGGAVLFGPHRMGELGRFTICREPGGAVFGVWEGDEHTGFGVYAEPGAFCWAEFYSRDAVATRNFLVAVFGLEYDVISETEAFTCFQLKLAGEPAPLFGVLQIDPSFGQGVPAFCVPYLWVPDLDTVIARVAALGGQVAQAPADGPFGRTAAIVDSGGAILKLVEPPQRPAAV